MKTILKLIATAVVIFVYLVMNEIDTPPLIKNGLMLVSLWLLWRSRDTKDDSQTE